MLVCDRRCRCSPRLVPLSCPAPRVARTEWGHAPFKLCSESHHDTVRCTLLTVPYSPLCSSTVRSAHCAAHCAARSDVLHSQERLSKFRLASSRLYQSKSSLLGGHARPRAAGSVHSPTMTVTLLYGREVRPSRCVFPSVPCTASGRRAQS